MNGKDQPPDPLDVTVRDLSPVPNTPPPLPSNLTPAPPISASEVTMLEAGTMHERPADPFVTMPAVKPVGSFTTALAAATNRIRISIPEAFLAAGTTGTLLRLVPVEQLRGRPPVELYLKTGPSFTLGRSPEADWIACFFPRNDKNDLRSRRLSKIHARVEHREGQLWVHRTSNSSLHIGQREVGNDPAGAALKESDQLVLAEDYALGVYFDMSLQGTLRFSNGDAWQKGRIAFNPSALGAVRFEPLNSALAIRDGCWLFVDVGFGSARGGVLSAGSELAPQQGVILTAGGCFWILNLVNNQKVAVNDYRPVAQEVIPLTQGDSVWLGAVRYRVEIA